MRSRQVFLAGEEYFFSDDRKRARSHDANLDPRRAHFQNFNLDIRSDEETFAGPPPNYEHGTSSSRARSGCRSE